MMDGMMGMGWWMLLWGFLALAVLVLAVVGTVWLVRSLTGRPSQPASKDEPAVSELRQRYAAGHIDREEYLRQLDDLRQR